MHDRDSHYNNVILHVVWVEDEPVLTATGDRIPCIELSGKVEKELLGRYDQLMNSEEWVPCASSLQSVSAINRTAWLDRLMSERLESKTDFITRILSQCNQDWEQTFFVILARHLGAPTNSDAMESLALKIPLTTLKKYGDRIDQVEAILFGVAGMLTKEMTTDYPMKLKREFDFLSVKHGFKPMPSLRWKFMRMRPVHFPTIRLAQLAKIVAESTHFISMLTEINTIDQWMEKLMVTPYHEYWLDHYHFKNTSAPLRKRLGRHTASSLLINVIAPVMFVYGRMQGSQALKDRAVQLLSRLPAEKNSIIQGWSECGWIAEDAGQTQALIHLKKNYCDHRRCLHCAIGLQVMK
jgi:hypothetical protein